MKERARKKLDKALGEACSKMEKPERRVGSILGDFAHVLAKCGSAPYEGCEEIAAQAMTVMSLVYLQIAEEHLIVNAVQRDTGIGKTAIPELSGESWSGLADKAIGYARSAVDCDTDDSASSALGKLLDSVIRRAQEVKQESGGSEARVVEHIAYSSVVYVPEGMKAPAYFATSLSSLTSFDLQQYISPFPNGDWLMSTIGFGGLSKVQDAASRYTRCESCHAEVELGAQQCPWCGKALEGKAPES